MLGKKIWVEAGIVSAKSGLFGCQSFCDQQWRLFFFSMLGHCVKFSEANASRRCPLTFLILMYHMVLSKNTTVHRGRKIGRTDKNWVAVRWVIGHQIYRDCGTPLRLARPYAFTHDASTLSTPVRNISTLFPTNWTYTMIPLIPTLALAFLSFVSSAFVILRIVIPILPPHPLSRRVSPVSYLCFMSTSQLNLL
jgi:hypothetical protein